MSVRVFLDTNVLVYLFDLDAPEKQSRAREILEAEGTSGRAVLSTQVLQEFYVSVTRKLARPLDSETAQRAVEDFSTFPVVQIDASLVLSAIARHRKEQVSFWDALIIQAALEGGASILYTEDLQHGRIIGGVRVGKTFFLK
jgi:predicted nucleic acid-binding protein